MNPDRALADEKAALRVEMIARRRLLPEKSRNAKSMAITDYVVSMQEVVNARHIHLYLSIPVLAEVCTTVIVDRLAAMEKELSVPVVRNGELVSALFRKGDTLLPTQFGAEPRGVSLVDESDLDVVLMPLVAFDKRGYRIGYGKGFYDRFLQRLLQQNISPCRIGLSFMLQQVDVVPANSWDEPLDGVVHEEGIIRFNS
ncbi:5-formyltetrahydrofolate cyclo-ligase [Pelodictyon phaeoclathratiforme]|jgi:5-formyltetrahydrofolate cyclo-ligase|uniref:5-formyltetrahydrofolate cyclo-ligase n=1 Tax=Pelodictyon phaeoclathratiforme (strain DSM 5477 / BU-1) TaxID=324925 RepID=B4S9S5_PELPB|nr:5-formyltetrahydrofolate cyclo-ligase [Pelodictyon phaeoclathratiforme]ACF43621.1 5-formyltetrahydrofolate cyclo-ligase [Pelodictyon phaeoclathratiforme BU-1]MBV5289081.1 5-formyltetrahydrofolate cyclo-ligase [Pelodictyon phaeoclathratiforme]